MFSKISLFISLLLFTGSHLYASNLPPFDISSIDEPRFREALHLCDHFYDFEKTHIDYIALTNQDTIPPEALKSYTQNLTSIKNIQNLIYKGYQKIITIDKILSELLDFRFALINDRHANICQLRATVNRGEKIHMIIPPTHPQNYNGLPEELKALVRFSTDRYQFFNKLILIFWSLIDPSSLSAHTKSRIRCSTTLWKNFSGESEDLGHPDEAIIADDVNPLPFELDWNNYDTYIRKFRCSIMVRNWKNQKLDLDLTPYEASLYDSSWKYFGKIKELSYPEWLKPKKTSQLFLEKEPTNKSLENLSSAASAVPLPTTPNLEEISVEASLSEHISLSEHSLKNKNMVVQEQEVSSSDIKGILATSAIIQKPSPELTQEEKVQSDDESQSLPNLSDNKPTISQNNLTKSEKDSSLSLPETYLRPAGLRKFHSKQLIIPQPLIKLSGTHASTLQKIFDLQQFKNVEYRQIRALWRYINGDNSVIESSGSSHKKFIAQNQQVFPGFAHGDSMTYTQSTIKYIRDMFRQIGYNG